MKKTFLLNLNCCALVLFRHILIGKKISLNHIKQGLINYWEEDNSMKLTEKNFESVQVPNIMNYGIL